MSRSDHSFCSRMKNFAAIAFNISGLICYLLLSILSLATMSFSIQAAEPSLPTNKTTWVFVDPAVKDYQQLIGDLPADAELRILQADRDGVSQIAEELYDQRHIAQIHLISHGRDGEIQAGNTWLSADNIDNARNHLAFIGEALATNGSIYIYGCQVAAGVKGKALLNNIASITNASVAASDDWTGDTKQGGNWQLETVIGSVQVSTIPLNKSYPHLLNTINAGDMVVLGWNATNDTVTFATLVSLPAGTVIKITDWGWNATGDTFTGSTTGDGLITWTTSSSINAGAIFNLFLGGTGDAQTTTLTNVTTSTDLTTDIAITGYSVSDPMNLAGDGIFIYQDSDNNPYFIFGINNSSGTNIDANNWNTSASFALLRDSTLPGGTGSQNALTNGTNAIGLPGGASQQDNVQYTGPTTSADKATWLNRVANVSNWSGDNTGATTTSVGTAGGSFIALPPPPPTVTDGNISISGATGTGGAYKIGDTVSATWNNTAGGDNNAGIIGVTVDFSQFGGGAAVIATDSASIWTAAYIIAAGAIDATNRNVSITANNANGPTTTADTSNATVDNIAPTVTDGNISISGATGASGAYKIGDTVTATWNNTAGGDNNTDTISSATVNFTQFGGGAVVAATNSSGTWTATYPIVAGAIDNTNRNISFSATDNAGNVTTAADTTNATVDNIAPTLSSITVSGSPGSGDTSMAFTANFSESVANVSTDDFTLVGTGSAAGSIASVSAASGSAINVNIAGISGTGDLKVNLNASTNVADDAGNTVAAFSSGSTHSVSILTAPDAPTIGTATAGDGQVGVTFTAPGSNGGSAITTYTATANPGDAFGTCAGPAACTATVTGLTNGTAYTFTVTATNAVGTSVASGATTSATPKGNQTITFTNPGAQNFGTAPDLSVLNGGASSTSALTVTFSSTTTGVCTITGGGALTFVTAGSCTIDAVQAGNTAWNAATTVTQTFTVNAIVPDAPTIGTASAGDTEASVSFVAPASAGGAAITGYTVTSNPGGLSGTGAGSPVTVTGLTNGVAYTFTVTATNSAGTGSASAASNSIIPASPQTITFANPGTRNFGTSPTLTASSSAGGGYVVTFTSSTTSVCSITSGGVLTFITTGTCTVNADQAGDLSFLAAPQVSQSFSVSPVVPGAPTIGTAIAGDTQASVAFVAPVNIGGSVITGYTVTVNPADVVPVHAGSSPIVVTGLTNGQAYTFTVTADNVAGTSPASGASNSITPAAIQTITFANPNAQTFGTSPTLTATSDSGLTPVFTSSTTGVCTITSGGALTFVTAGSCTINADQAGNSSYLPATQVSRTFAVNAVVAGAPTIGAAIAGDSQAVVSFTAPIFNGGSSITAYTVTSSPGGFTGSGAGSPITVTGLSNGTAYTFSVTAANTVGSGNASSASNSVTPNGAPTISGSPILIVNQDASYQFTPTASDSVGDTLSFSISNKPTWATFNTATGMLSGIPLNQDVGVTNGIVISVSDGTLSASLPAFNLTVTNVNDAPTISSMAMTAATQDAAYSYIFAAADTDVGDVLTLSAITKPSWLSFNAATGVLSGTPTNADVGSHPVTLRVRDTDGLTADQSFMVIVTNVNDAPVISSPAITTATQDIAYSYTVIATDLDVGAVLTLSVVTKPSWLSFNAVTGLLSGTPSNADVGSHAVLLRVTDADGLTADQSFSITVTNSNDAPTITSTATTAAVQDAVYSYTFAATDVDVDDVLTFSAVTIPSWLSFNAATGLLSGTPDNADVGSHPVTLRVTDTDGLTAEQSFSITVTNVNDAPVATSASVTLEEDSSVMITLTGEDADSDSLTYEVVSQPESGTLEQHGTVWLYTPEKDFNGADQISFIAKDAELSSEPATITMNVTPVNDDPQAVDDNYTLASTADDKYTLPALENDVDVDGDTLTIDGAAADIGSVQITADGLIFTAPAAYVGPVALRYTISDGQKGRASAKVNLLVEGGEADNLPVITVPNDVEVNATGLFTRVDLGFAKAVDRTGRPLPVSLVDKRLFFAPGSYLAYWQAVDRDGNKATKAQKVKVHPLISLSKDQVVGEGNEVVVSIHLNGVAPEYPISVPYTVAGSADSNDHDLVDAVVEITSGTLAHIHFRTIEDGEVEAEEEVLISLDPSLNLGSKKQTQVSITEANIAPSVTLEVTQAGERQLIVAQNGGEVHIHAQISDANMNDTLTSVWSSGALNLQSDDAGMFFLPTEVLPGIYPVSLTVTDSGLPALSTTEKVYIVVRPSLPALTGTDTDGDLVPDNQEGFTDTDRDGIPDYLDAINECNVMPEDELQPVYFLAEGQAGVCLRLGNIALMQEQSGIQLLPNLVPEDSIAANVGGVFDFIATGLPQQGQSYSLVIPQRSPVPANAVYRKYQAQNGWKDFVIDARNSVASSEGERGFCPPPGDNRWTSGLTEGHWCVQLTIEDGGPNDDDGVANRTIVDPSGVSVILNGNHLPVANPDTVSLPWNQSLDVDVLANDTDSDGDALTVTQVTSEFGTVVILANQQLSYTPATDFIGTDVLVYSITDGKGGTASSELTVIVNGNTAPTTVNDSAAIDDRTSLLLDVLSNDSDPDGNVLTLVSATAQQGMVSVESNKLRYIPKTGFDGVDTVSYQISDGLGGEATGQALITVKAYQDVVIDNKSGGGSMSLWALGLILTMGLIRRKELHKLVLGTVLLVGSVNQANAADNWYVEGFVGQAQVDSSRRDLQPQAGAGFVTSVDDKDTALGVSIGYQWTPYVAIELGYADFGNGTARIEGASLTPEQYHEQVKAVTPVLADGVMLGLRFTLLQHEAWRFEVPIGLFRWQADISSTMGNSRLTTELEGTDWYAGVRFSYQFSDSWSVGLGYQYVDIEPNDFLCYQLNLRYQF
ncbi:Ig-like domain-containing protein [Shewanella sp. SM72]|uniref:Ig-like domain-containing protein n=1 Tax=Shewanella sp. SM72 TaxID=2912805 RepID=UPI0021DB3337|nr:Ig-like domain-containing protein [Shewanella sp. SM72]MCU8017565.1 Ig-like domain-containing protein [Shewanella sp. SM72]